MCLFSFDQKESLLYPFSFFVNDLGYLISTPNHNFFGVANLIQDNFEYLDKLKTQKYQRFMTPWVQKCDTY